MKRKLIIAAVTAVIAGGAALAVATPAGGRLIQWVGDKTGIVLLK